MKNITLFSSAIAALTLNNCASLPASNDLSTNYRVIETIDAPDAGYDYVSVDPTENKLFVGREYGVMTVDLNNGNISTLLNRDDVAAVLMLPNSDLMLSTNYDSNNATLFNRKTAEVIADIPTGQEPDGALYDPVSSLIFVMNGESENVTVIDPDKAQNIATIQVGGVPEAASTANNGRVYINIDDTNEIVVIDIASLKVTNRYPLPKCNEPTGIAYDPVTNLLISVCHNNIAKLIDANTGEDRGDFPIGSGTDGSIFNVETRIGYVSCIDGTLTVYHLSKDGQPTVLQNIQTADGARTQAYNPVTDRLYLPAASVERDSEGSYIRAEKGFKIVVVGQE